MKPLLIAVLALGAHCAASQQITYQQTIDRNVPAGQTEFLSYVAKDGSLYMVGNKLKLGMPRSGSEFSFITNGDGVLTPLTKAQSSFSGLEVEIRKIQLAGSKKAGYRVYISFKLGVNYKIDFENAIEAGEVKSYGMTSDEALAALKKAKDKLDLGLITQAKYDSIKGVLSKFIN